MRIAFTGPGGSGKDFAAEHLVSRMGGQILKFADPLYSLMYQIQNTVGVPQVKDRELLQWIGTWGRSKDPDMWIKLFEQEVKQYSADVNLFVTDARFPNEVGLLRDYGFTLVRITRADLPNADAPWRDHPSEHALDDYTGWDIKLTNCGEGTDFLSYMTAQINTHFDLPTRVHRDSYIITPP